MARLERYEDAPKSVHFSFKSLSPVKRRIRYSACIMSEKVELPKKKATPNPGKLETEDMPSVTPRKRKTGRTADRDPSTHEAGRHAEPTPRGVTAQGRRSDRKPACPANSIFLRKTTVVSIQSTERQRQRHSQTLPAHRRMSIDMHRPRRSNMSNPGSRPVRTRRPTNVPPGPPRTMLQRMCTVLLTKPRPPSSPGMHIIVDAWHTVLNSDPLVDSDEECPDEHLRLDYSGPLMRQLYVICVYSSNFQIGECR